MASAARKEIYALVDKVPEWRLKTLAKLIRAIVEEEADEETIIEPLYDEELTEEERQALSTAEADIAAGRGKPWEQVKRELGL